MNLNLAQTSSWLASLDPNQKLATPSLDESVRRASHLVDDQLGLLSHVFELDLDVDDPAMIWSRSVPSDPSLIGLRPALNIGSAVSDDPKRAYIKAVGESIERYCAAQFDETNLTFSPFDLLKREAVDPRNFSLFSEYQYQQDQFPYQMMSADADVHWVEGWNFSRLCPTLVPATFVYVPFSTSQQKKPVWDNISTGLACAPTLEGAVLSGLFECLERDAFMITWLRSMPCPELNLARWDNSAIRKILEKVKKVGLEIRCFDISVDTGVAVILAICLNPTGIGYPKSAIGLGTSTTIERALFLSLEELCLGINGMSRAAISHGKFVPNVDFSDVDNLEKHGLYYATNPDAINHLDFLLGKGGPERTNADSQYSCLVSEAGDNVTISAITSCLSSCDLEVIAVDVTTPEVREAGFNVVRTVIPGVEPLHNNHNFRLLGGKRAALVPERLGRIALNASNTAPHPFP